MESLALGYSNSARVGKGQERHDMKDETRGI